MLKHLTTALLVGLATCDDGGPGGAARSLEILPADSSAARGLRHKGTVVQTARWRDRLGEHTLLLTETGEFPTPGQVRDGGEDPWRDAELYAYDYAVNGSSPELVWRTFDHQRECEFDLTAAFVPGSLTITDLDANGVGEVTFLYTLHCTSDVSPATRKLIMREGEAKYAIRGTTKLPRGYGGGEMHLDPSFRAAPKPFREHAVQRWNRYVADMDWGES